MVESAGTDVAEAGRQGESTESTLLGSPEKLAECSGQCEPAYEGEAENCHGEPAGVAYLPEEVAPFCVRAHGAFTAHPCV